MSILTCRARSPTPLRSTRRSRRCSCPPALARGLPAGTPGSGEKPLQWETQSSADFAVPPSFLVGPQVAHIGLPCNAKRTRFPSDLIKQESDSQGFLTIPTHSSGLTFAELSIANV